VSHGLRGSKERLALILPLISRNDFVFGYVAKEKLNGRTTKRNIGRRRGVEIRRRMYLNDLDFYYRVLGFRLRQLLIM
jgi:hypothetical protein